MAQSSAGHVFISYSREDKAVMQRVAKYLQERGIPVWVDNDKLVTGTSSWDTKIEQAIRGASAAIVLLSPDSKKSRWVQREISFAEDNNIHIFPVLVRGSKKASIPLRLIDIQYKDMRQDKEVELEKLCIELTRFLAERGVEETENQVPAIADEEEGEENIEEANAELTPVTKWNLEKVIVPLAAAVITAILGPILVLVLNRIFLEGASTSGSIPTPANMFAPVPVSTVTPPNTVTFSLTFMPTPFCPTGKQPPSIELNFEPRSVKINEIAKLTISDLKNGYEVLAITAEKGEFPSGKDEPYRYIAPGSPGKDIVTVWVGDHECQTKEEITITITQ